MGVEAENNPSMTLEENLKKALTELLMLHLLSEKECYIGELTAAISVRSKGALSVVFPYSAVYRLERLGCIRETGKRTAPDGRRRQYLGITQEGRAYLQRLRETYKRFSTGVADIMKERGDQP